MIMSHQSTQQSTDFSLEFSVSLHQSLANTLKVLAIEAVEKANSGHPGAPMGLAHIATTLWHHLNFDPQDDQWSGRDRFILSCGHASMLLYGLLHLWKCGLTIDDLKAFRQLASLTPGHPERGWTKGVEMTTGPLGQGVATSVGVALGQRILDAKLREAGSPENHPWAKQRTIVLCSDGDLMEGISYEAAALAGLWQLGHLVWFYDDNGISIDGKISISWHEDCQKRFEAMGWRVLKADGHDTQSLLNAWQSVENHTGSQPTLVICKTQIGFGSPNKVNHESVHGSPLGAKELALTKENLKWTHEPFEIPQVVAQYYDLNAQKKHQARLEWDQAYQTWAQNYPKANDLYLSLSKSLDVDTLMAELIPVVSASGATRKLSNQALVKAYELFPSFIGGSADLSGSNGLVFPQIKAYSASQSTGTKIHFGIREHAMGAIINGLNLSNTWKAFGGTFLVFSDYLKPAIRLAAISHIPSLFIFSHDSYKLGEDGSTHQPIEHLFALRMIPNVVDFRPADGLETAVGWAYGLSQKASPFCMVLTRQDLTKLNRRDGFDPKEILKGAYLLAEQQGHLAQSITFVGTGSEIQLCLDSASALNAQGYHTRVISMPSMHLFFKQDAQWQSDLLGHHLKNHLIVSVEAGSGLPWKAITGLNGLQIAMDGFGASAPMEALDLHFGFTSKQVVDRVLDRLK
jgi:transketolase